MRPQPDPDRPMKLNFLKNLEEGSSKHGEPPVYAHNFNDRHLISQWEDLKMGEKYFPSKLICPITHRKNVDAPKTSNNSISTTHRPRPLNSKAEQLLQQCPLAIAPNI